MAKVRSTTWGPAVWLVPLAVTTAGCELFTYADRNLIPKGTTTSTGAGGEGGAGGTGGIGGEGGAAPAAATSTSTGGIACFHAETCPGADTDCMKRACEGGHCGFTLEPEGTPTSTQLPGDCKREVCDAAGLAKIVDDDGDVLADTNPCTLDICAEGMPSHVPGPAGSSCDTNGGTVCDGAESCVECLGKAQCAAGEACLDTQCISMTCLNQMFDGTETDVDCGGASCNPCAPGKACLLATDCTSHVCASTCQAPFCGDGAKNGSETDVDCGGTCASSCGVGLGCKVDSDCLGGACAGGACLPTCTDQAHDGAETDVDCGGGSCAGCALGMACLAGADCASGTCSGGACVTTAPTCANGMLDGSESDIDCGGAACLGCNVGATCIGSADCLTGRCDNGLCAPVLLISEARTRGAAGSLDELVELYNPGKIPITVDGTWTLNVRSAVGACATNTASVKFAGAGQIVPPHGHLLIVGSGYTQSPAGDAPLVNGGIADAGSLGLYHGATLVDALCYSYDAATQTNLTSCAVSYVCKGATASNLPHDNTQSAASTVDVSLERKPGGGLGNQIDTGDNLADFGSSKPAKPQNLGSPAVP